MTPEEKQAEIKSYYSQELLDGVKPIDAETAEFLWNMMTGIGERRMKADAESRIASILKATNERLNAQAQEYVSELREMFEKHFDGHIISEKEWERYIPKISIKTCMNCFYNYGARHNVEFNPKDIVCEYWESDGLTKDDFCSRWKDKESEDAHSH